MIHLSAIASSIILGFVEGATEFIPVSSSGHLIVARAIFGDTGANSLAFDAVLQLSASCALLVYFWRDIWQLLKFKPEDRTLLWAIIIGTIPAVIFGLLLEKEMETVFRSSHLVALTLILGSILMYSAQKFAKSQQLSKRVFEEPEPKRLSLTTGIKIGFFQVLALIPGISRSGATISGGLFSGLTQEEATRFSFLLSLPILFGAGLKKLFDIRSDLFYSTSSGFGISLFLGSLTAFVVGLLSIRFLMKYLKTHRLDVFIYYRIILAILILVLL